MIPTRIDNSLQVISSTNHTAGGGTNYTVETPTGVIYHIYIDTSQDPVFIKSVDYGLSFSAPTQLKACSCIAIAVWYDYWTDPTGALGGLIHVVYIDATSDDVFYRTIDTTSSDSLGTERTPFLGTNTAAGGAVSVSRMIGGNVILSGSIDAGAENFCYKTSDLGVNWTSITNPYEASPDKLIMMPGWGADTQDAMCFYYDNSAQEISVKYYDDSGDSWSETSIATSIVHPDHTTLTLGHWAATVDHANSQNLLAFWTAVDTANADLRVFKVTQSAQTETAANVVLNSTDDQGFCGITIFGTSWYVFYCGASDGSEIYASQLNRYYKISVDGGVNWSSETKLNIFVNGYSTFIINPIAYKTFSLQNYSTSSGLYYRNSLLAIPHTTFQLGM